MRYFYFFIIGTFLFSCSKKESQNWTPLLDADLSQWDTYLSYLHQVGYKGETPVDSLGNEIPPIGFQDTLGIFTTKQENNETILHVSGECYGALISKESYENYHLQLQVKWGEKKWGFRKNLLKDSGVLYHSIGEPGAEYFKSWMLSQEFQIMEGHTGDFWSQANSAIDIRAIEHEGMINAIADENYPFLPFGKGSLKTSFCARSANHESKNNEWTTLDLYCFENKSIHLVNGHVVMILKNSRYFENGKNFPLQKGKLQLQSEGSEVYFKNIKIESLNTFPKKLEKYYR